MSSAVRLSPSASLLRNSRVFAIPQPLKPPQQQVTPGTTKESDTATASFPLHQSIETTPTSLARGDWGLKRPLPAKSTTRSSARPVIRLNGVDTIEHVTDFSSAADHTKTLHKFQEMNLPLTMHAESPRGFSSVHSTDPHKSPYDNDNIGVAAAREARWRFKGPWVTGMSELEFSNYIESLQAKKPALMDKLYQLYVASCEKESASFETERLAAVAVNKETKLKINEKRQLWVQMLRDGRKNYDGGDRFEHMIVDELAQRAAARAKIAEFGARKPSAAGFQQFLKTIRTDELKMSLTISELLDLAPTMPLSVKQSPALAPASRSVFAYLGPPRTHPGAGLSYIRTKAHVLNHPQYGPQKDDAPVQARVLRPKRRFGKVRNPALGVGGIVTLGHLSTNDLRGRNDYVDGLEEVNPDAHGGSKIWVRTEKASVDAKGSIRLNVSRADSALMHVWGVQDASMELMRRKAEQDIGKAISLTSRRTTRATASGAGQRLAMPATSATSSLSNFMSSSE